MRCGDRSFFLRDASLVFVPAERSPELSVGLLPAGSVRLLANQMTHAGKQEQPQREGFLQELD